MFDRDEHAHARACAPLVTRVRQCTREVVDIGPAHVSRVRATPTRSRARHGEARSLHALRRAPMSDEARTRVDECTTRKCCATCDDAWSAATRVPDASEPGSNEP